MAFSSPGKDMIGTKSAVFISVTPGRPELRTIDPRISYKL